LNLYPFEVNQWSIDLPDSSISSQIIFIFEISTPQTIAYLFASSTLYFQLKDSVSPTINF